MAKYKIIPSSRTIVQSPISIGHKAEKGVEAIEFDLTAWVETYGSGTLTVIMRRWGDAIPYPIALEIDENNKATWVLSDTDTAKAGMAYAQLSYIVGETVVKKSDIYTFRVMDSLTGEGDPPEAYESWLEHLTHFAAEAMAEVLDIESIVTDKTLTVDGGIADAKATGEALAEKVDAADYSELSARVGANTIALAEKADRSTTYTKAQVDQMIEDVEVETDTTLEIAGAPADAKKVGDELSDIKADLADVGLTDDIKAALLACFDNVGWKGDSSPFYIERLRAALYRESELEKFFTNGLGLTVSNNVPTVSTNTKRGLLYQKEGTTPLLSSVQGVNNVYPIHIPQGATGVKFHGMQTSDYISINLQILAYVNGSWNIMHSAGFAKIVPDILSRTEIANYNNGNYYMIGTYGISDATHTNPLDGTVTVDTSDFTMEVVAE